MYYLMGYLDNDKLYDCLTKLIYQDDSLNIANRCEIIERLENTFSNSEYLQNLDNAKNNWLSVSSEVATQAIISFLRKIK